MTAEDDKKEWREELGRLTQTVPNSVKAGSWNRVYDYKQDLAKASKLAKNERASVQELESAVARMRTYFP